MDKDRSQDSLIILKWRMDKQVSSQAHSLDSSARTKPDIRRD